MIAVAIVYQSLGLGFPAVTAVLTDQDRPI